MYGDSESGIGPDVQKTMYANGSDTEAETQAVQMRVFRTLKLRGVNSTDAIAGALRQFLESGELPTLRSISTAGG